MEDGTNSYLYYNRKMILYIIIILAEILSVLLNTIKYGTIITLTMPGLVRPITVFITGRIEC